MMQIAFLGYANMTALDALDALAVYERLGSVPDTVTPMRDLDVPSPPV